MNNLNIFTDPLSLADQDAEYAKMLLKVLEEESKKPMVDNGGNNQVKGGESTSSGDANIRR
jgi:hypothetical protein